MTVSPLIPVVVPFYNREDHIDVLAGLDRGACHR